MKRLVQIIVLSNHFKHYDFLTGIGYQRGRGGGGTGYGREWGCGSQSPTLT